MSEVRFPSAALKLSRPTRFIGVRDEISKLVVRKYHGMIGPFERIITNEFDSDGRAEAIAVSPDGTWDLSTGMDCTEIGKDPSANELIEVFAVIRDERYRSLLCEEMSDGVFSVIKIQERNNI